MIHNLQRSEGAVTWRMHKKKSSSFNVFYFNLLILARARRLVIRLTTATLMQLTSSCTILLFGLFVSFYVLKLKSVAAIVKRSQSSIFL